MLFPTIFLPPIKYIIDTLQRSVEISKLLRYPNHALTHQSDQIIIAVKKKKH